MRRRVAPSAIAIGSALGSSISTKKRALGATEALSALGTLAHDNPDWTFPDLTDAGPGSLVSAVKMPDFDRTNFGRSIRSARVLYRSTAGDTGAPTVVSGSVFTPKATPPPGGWPVVAIGHGTVGIDNQGLTGLEATRDAIADGHAPDAVTHRDHLARDRSAHDVRQGVGAARRHLAGR